ncbi:MAG: hypothetical protein IKZ45_07890 [Fibrobacter sp.]|nr:hypothetical protein [Fibrobacter sp.]
MIEKIYKAMMVLLVAVVSLICAAEAQTKVACVGNSITEGFGLSWHEDYPYQLQQLLGDSYAVTNFGVSSMTFANKGPNDNMSYWNTQKFKDALASSPDIVVIELGTNDSKFFTNNCIGTDGQPTYNYNYGQYEKQALYKDYEALLDTFAHLPTSPRVIATLQPYSNNCGWGIMDTAIVNQINPIIKDVATKKGVEIIDLHAEFNMPAWFLADSVHPNANGAVELAKIIEKYILLEKPASGDSTVTGDTTTVAQDSTVTQDSTGQSQDSTVTPDAIRRNAAARKAALQADEDTRVYDVQGRQKSPVARKSRARHTQSFKRPR